MEIIEASSLDRQIGSAVAQGHHDGLLGSIRLPVRVKNVRAVRQFVRLQLDIETLPSALIDEAELIASELVTNVVNHHDRDVEPAMQVDLHRDGASLRIEVHDMDPAVPKRRFPSSSEENGRGLSVVEALTDHWGVTSTEDGKFVWAELIAWPSETPGLGA